MEILLSIILLVFGILQVILFFKIWGMTNDIAEMNARFKAICPTEEEKKINALMEKQKLTDSVNAKAINDITERWGKDLTESEINQAKSLIGKIYANELIVKDLKKETVFVWDKETWEQNKHQTDKYKLLYSK